MKVGIIGNTVLTYKAIQYLLSQGCEIQYVFGLPPKKLKTKVNPYDLKSFCKQKNIRYINDNSWETILPIDVEVVYEMGDSRIVPASFLKAHTVVGNHGAELPAVQGAASLVWGRMLNSGRWGVSLMELSEEIDGGDILTTKPVFYDKDLVPMKEFVEMCDNMTIECLKQYFMGTHERRSNKKAQVKITKQADSSKVISLLEMCLEGDVPVYLPPRRPSDGEIKSGWSRSFIADFKVANDKPYPVYFAKVMKE